MHFLHHHPPFSRLSRGRAIAARVLLGLSLAIVLALAFGWIVQLLWNGLMPAIFAAPALGFWQAVGLLLLARILTGRIGPGRPPHFPHRDGSRSWCGTDDCWAEVREEPRKEGEAREGASPGKQSA